MVLSAENNKRLTSVGPGTEMGELLRRYWHPIAAESEIGERATKKVRLLGEDLVLFRNRKGGLGLIEERCPHRKVSLVYGIPEDDGIRCQYHGWCFRNDGQCTEQPNEPENSTFKNRVKITSYEVQAVGGLIFAYMGPKPAPELPKFDLFVEDNVIRTIGYQMIPCNWLQIMENSMDPTHLEWLHGRYFQHIFEKEGRPAEDWPISKHHVKIGFDEFEYGIIKRRILEGQTEECEDWRIGHPVVFPTMLRVGDGGAHTFQIRVPVDDTHTLHFWYTCFVPKEGVEIPKDYPISLYECPLKDENGEFITDYIDGQDMMAWVTQGEIADRTTEKLGTSDKGIIMYRKMLMNEMKRVQEGEDPKCVIRDYEKAQFISLPQEENKYDEGELLTGVAKDWNTRYAPNIDEIIDICKGRKKVEEIKN
ncbi:aromatic ring-hydroxylating dioxygenase subunit alpha [Halalkalibacter alkaliphilus]|uniref:Aromatic ring-hydroxylating dioxygenase subunit alpha n=1 Tax=Halalkalibacter alkaliphilus TaxID=2917993 RepID=A0A9X2CUU9_9BACI|nr:aromatic ring-hydroxylating dioxygenase subunit alpha [Halalkalibacter alkaliphilus]MCL7748636.1 aromatic ring-hydroxylating dioxygenase subunit alpha [Halalkalibacter alkaliphilus]